MVKTGRKGKAAKSPEEDLDLTIQIIMGSKSIEVETKSGNAKIEDASSNENEKSSKREVLKRTVKKVFRREE